MIKSDVERLRGKSGLFELARAILVNRPFRVIFTYRCCRWASASKYGFFFLPFFRLAHRWTQGAIGFELPISVTVGSGLKVFHGWALVINSDVQIGNNVTLLHSVTIGATNRGSPRIGDNVVISAGAIVLGNISIGDGSVVGAGAVIIKNVPNFSIVVGNPQRIIGSRADGRAMNLKNNSDD